MAERCELPLAGRDPLAASLAGRCEFLLEIGCEEIPASWLPGLTRQLSERIESLAAEQFLEPRDVEAYSTPRRLVVRAEVVRRQSDRQESFRGPALEIAKTPPKGAGRGSSPDLAQGDWTPAAHGFAKRHGVTVEQLRVDVDPTVPPPAYAGKTGLYVFVDKTTIGSSADKVLPNVVAATLRSLSFPKTMSWDAWLDDGKGAFPFGRPIRWLVALLDGAIVPFTVFELAAGQKGPALVKAGNVSFGHRFLPPGQAGQPFPVTGFADLCAKLREHGVVLEAAERESLLETQLEGLISPGELIMIEDRGLIEEWVHLVEHPQLVRGSVPAEFRSLPVEVLRTVLVHHQKYVPVVEKKQGGTVVGFVGLTNIDATASGSVVRNMERVCVARFRDAAFFYGEDRKQKLDDRLPALKGVTFHQKLGSYFDKAQRLVKLVNFMAEQGWLTEHQCAQARRAAELCKADLTTLTVREFTELQGMMGGIFLASEGEAAAVWRAVYWHYHPIAIGEHDVPLYEHVGTPAVFGAVSLADKLDTLAGYFSIGANPTGSSDPFALRRAAQGAVRVALDFWINKPRPDLRALARAALDQFAFDQKNPRGKVEAVLIDLFLEDRLEYVLGQRGFGAGEVDAVLEAAPDALADAHDALQRLQALKRVRHEARADFDALAEAFKRASNILSGQSPAERIEAALFERDSERDLSAAVDTAAAAQDGRGYEDRLRALAALREPVDRFFAREQDGGVMVMADDPAVRANRLALLARARGLFHSIADVSKLGGTQ